MGFNLGKAISRAVGLPDKIGIPIVTALFPATLATSVAVNAIQGVGAQSGLSQSHQQALQSNQNFVFDVPGQSPSGYQPYQVVPSGFSDYSPIYTGPQLEDFSADYGLSNQEAMPWDYSTPSPAFSTVPTLRSPAYSAPTQGSFLDSLGTFLPLALDLL